MIFRGKQFHNVGPKNRILYFCRVNLRAVMCTQCRFLVSYESKSVFCSQRITEVVRQLVHSYLFDMVKLAVNVGGVHRGGAFNTELLPVADDATLLLAGPDTSDVIDDACQ